MSFLTRDRPRAPRLNRKRQIARQDSQTTLREEPEPDFDDQGIMATMASEYDYAAPPVPPKFALFDPQKSLPEAPEESPTEIYNVDGMDFRMERPPTPPSPPVHSKTKPSASNRWKAAMGKIWTRRKPSSNIATGTAKRSDSKASKHLTPPPLSPASSRQPSFYVPTRRDQPQRSAVTLLTSGSSTQDGHDDDYGDDGVTNIGLSRTSFTQYSPVTPASPRGGHMVDHYFEPISSVLRRADTIPSPITPYSPVRRQSTRPKRNNKASQPARQQTQQQQRQQRPEPPRTPSPPPVWPAPGSPPLIVANPSRSPSPPPSPPPLSITPSKPSTSAAAVIKRTNTYTRTSEPPRPKIKTSPSENSLPPSTAAQKKAGPRILQAHLPSPIAPDPKKHVFTGPWFNRRGDEWLGIGEGPGEYKVKAAKDDKAFDPKYSDYPEEMHRFMNAHGAIMDAKTLQMVSKAAH